MIKLVVSEVDGVLTDGKIVIDELGNVPFKEFCLNDFESVNLIKKTTPVVFLSSDNSISYHLFRRKNIPFYWTKNKNKTLLEVLRRYQVTAEEVLYIGSKISDIECMNTVPNSICTNEFLGFPLLKTVSGNGVFSEVFVTYFK